MQHIGPQKLKAEHLDVFNNLRKITPHYGDLNFLLNPWRLSGLAIYVMISQHGIWRLSGLEFFAVNWSTLFILKAELLDRMATTQEAWVLNNLLTFDVSAHALLLLCSIIIWLYQWEFSCCDASYAHQAKRFSICFMTTSGPGFCHFHHKPNLLRLLPVSPFWPI